MRHYADIKELCLCQALHVVLLKHHSIALGCFVQAARLCVSAFDGKLIQVFHLDAAIRKQWLIVVVLMWIVCELPIRCFCLSFAYTR